jgi:hypothetical protein
MKFINNKNRKRWDLISMLFIPKINWFAKISFSNLLIMGKDEAKLVFKVHKYQDIYRPEHLSSKYVKTFIVFIMATEFFAK